MPAKKKKVAPSLDFGNEPVDRGARELWNNAHRQLEERDRKISEMANRLAGIEHMLDSQVFRIVDEEQPCAPA